ncbi:hypothetical protein GCM10011494_26670 [Novosphingobium endophyticum]|uniref:Phytanoyl-CoA dioxygenase n=1 Tax=Novosphingobium endophyticum TaxID=1955250 RepID=A0A916X553_9SPHN|nr:phytanoyl-CoA dioxygenase family protein [Novosphingobium endophyticum]GGC06712.1 hypothetical protein GCM10011494_26670 [Novosphingobium endophyticum]
MEFAYPEPWSISGEIAARAGDLGVLGHLEQLRDEGYANIPSVYDAEFCRELREAVVDATARESGGYFDLKPSDGRSAYHLLGANDLFAQALLSPVLQVVAEYLCGGDFLLSQLSASVRYEGAAPMALHIDSQWIPPTPYNPMFTACLALDELSEEAGATRVIPGSHKLMRNPGLNEAAACEKGVAMSGSVGSMSIWTGYAWHANFARSIPGERALLHMTFCRLGYRPVEDYSDLGDDFLSRWPPVMATMLGRNSWLGLAGRNGGRCEMEHYTRMWAAARR